MVEDRIKRFHIGSFLTLLYTHFSPGSLLSIFCKHYFARANLNFVTHAFIICWPLLTQIGILCVYQAFERSRAFGFLLELKKRFTTVYGYRLHSALPYAMNSEFSPLMASEMVGQLKSSSMRRAISTRVFPARQILCLVRIKVSRNLSLAFFSKVLA